MHMCAGLIKVVSVCKEAILLIKGKTSDSIVRLCWNKSGVAFTAKLETGEQLFTSFNALGEDPRIDSWIE